MIMHEEIITCNGNRFFIKIEKKEDIYYDCYNYILTIYKIKSILRFIMKKEQLLRTVASEIENANTQDMLKLGCQYINRFK